MKNETNPTQTKNTQSLFQKLGKEKAVVVLNPVYLKAGVQNKSEILPLHIEFAVTRGTQNYVQDQADEIKRILIVYFSNKDPQQLKSVKNFTLDTKLTGTINGFLKSGHIEASRYKITKEVL